MLIHPFELIMAFVSSFGVYSFNPLLLQSFPARSCLLWLQEKKNEDEFFFVNSTASTTGKTNNYPNKYYIKQNFNIF